MKRSFFPLLLFVPCLLACKQMNKEINYKINTVDCDKVNVMLKNIKTDRNEVLYKINSLFKTANKLVEVNKINDSYFIQCEESLIELGVLTQEELSIVLGE